MCLASIIHAQLQQDGLRRTFYEPKDRNSREKYKLSALKTAQHASLIKVWSALEHKTV
jgi:tRNA U34 2-thiouridine synthase MnmA/TrmU